MSKLANPWKCDASNCGMLRANDTNHWMTVELGFYEMPPLRLPYVVIAPWNEETAQRPLAKHACGVECGLKVAAQLIVENFFPNELSSIRNDVASGSA